MAYHIRNFLGLTLCLFGGLTALPEDWPQFRGPSGQGNTACLDLPLQWSETRHVEWKTPIHGRAWSSPVVMEGRVWLTTATEDGTRLSGLAVDAATGAIIHDLELFEVEDPQFAHKFNTYASPTPVVEPGRVYITFGSPGTACLDAETGRVIWQRRDLPCDHFRGAGSSPILWRDLFILHYDGSDHQYVVALNKNTGKTVWRTERSVDFRDLDTSGQVMLDGDLRKGYSTPLIIELSGRSAMLSLGSRALYLYDPSTGHEFWKVAQYNCHSGTCRPLWANGQAFISWGFPKSELSSLAVNASGLTIAPEEVWKVKRNAPSKPSPVIVNDLLFMVDDGGVASCLDIHTGQTVWNERIQGNHSASPIANNERVYFFDESGVTTVLATSRKFTVLAKNPLSDGFMASPAVHGNALILRTRSHLYRIAD